MRVTPRPTMAAPIVLRKPRRVQDIHHPRIALASGEGCSPITRDDGDILPRLPSKHMTYVHFLSRTPSVTVVSPLSRNGDVLLAPTVDEQRVKEIIAAVYGRSAREREVPWEAIGSDEPLYGAEGEESLGLDSLDAVEIATELEEAFDVVMPNEIDPAELRTVRLVVAMLEQLVKEQHRPE
jgi:acyl carrier protein